MNTQNLNLGQMFGDATNYIKQYPGTAAGIGLAGALNVDGLFDNNKILGQAGGTALGALGAKLLAPKLLGGAALNVPSQVFLALAGGGLGSLYDKLRASKETNYNNMKKQNRGR